MKGMAPSEMKDSTDQCIAVINVVAIAAEQAASVIEYFKTPYITSP